ncbi:hypothetical protein AV530_005284 [Patagioenas fasciata monilis]|uniref:Uncharacterized protein n=1 Tax=Patagioenas fasciata monilis TaxID=372326 RepID=A0A1V4JKQ2_PATFA|nr:hypothetical protein AV530_005284 [Patagioenas fasciata monilis]
MVILHHAMYLRKCFSNFSNMTKYWSEGARATKRYIWNGGGCCFKAFDVFRGVIFRLTELTEGLVPLPQATLRRAAPLLKSSFIRDLKIIGRFMVRRNKDLS